MGQGGDGVVTVRPTARRMFELVEPIGVLPYGDDALDEVVGALGLKGIWDGYFACRAAALGRVPAEVVHALFYNFFPGEVARHLPRVGRDNAGGGVRGSRRELCPCPSKSSWTCRHDTCRRTRGRLAGASRHERAD